MAVVGYAATAHWAMATGQTLPALMLMLLLLVSSAVLAFRAKKWGVGCGWLAGTAGILWLDAGPHPVNAFYLPPIMITSLLFWTFARSLASGRTPLITLFATLLDGELDEATNRYTRRATLWWSGFLAFLLTETVLLAAFAPREVWSVFSHFINYVLLGGFFFVEYRLRRHCLPHYSSAGFLSFMKSVPHVFARAMRQIQ